MRFLRFYFDLGLKVDLNYANYMLILFLVVVFVSGYQIIRK